MIKNSLLAIIMVVFLQHISIISFSQIIVTGTVKEGCKGGQLQGATVQIKGKKIKVETNRDGQYRIRCKHRSDTLVFSFLGYKSYMQQVGKQRVMNVTLLDDTVQLKEIPVVGYGVRWRSDATGKPVIYLYPTQTTKINLKLNYHGKLMTTYPLYADGWNVEAQPDGTLHTSDGKEYSYLFWDGLKQYSQEELTYSTGYFVPGDSALSFLQNILPQTGLLPREYNEFIVYWLPFLQAHQLSFVHFRLNDEYATISTNTVNPKPDSEIRVFMEFKAVEKPLAGIRPQTIKAPLRKGFTLVEWGGTEISEEIIIGDKRIGFSY